MRSFPAVQWNTAGWASGAASTSRAPMIWGAASSSISLYCAPSNPGWRSQLSTSGSWSMKGKWWKATGCAATLNRLCSTS